jgi:hypothetical protein
MAHHDDIAAWRYISGSMASLTRDRLEAALRASWERDDLAVYADLLQSEGDPRGELIALDLAKPDDRRSTEASEWRDRRRNLIAAWVGDRWVAAVERYLHQGFLEGVDERAAELLATPAGHYLRSFHISEWDHSASATFEALIARPRPWLTRLEIHARLPASARISDLVHAAPNLAELSLSYAPGRFEHPSVKLLIINGDAIDDLLSGQLRCPAAVEVDIALPSLVTGATWFRQPMLTVDRFPALRVLRLGRNTGIGATAAIDLFGSQPIRSHLERVELPALERSQDVTILEAILENLPAHVTVNLERTYERALLGGHLSHRFRNLHVPIAFPWPRRVHYEEVLIVEIPYQLGSSLSVEFELLQRFLEAYFESFSLAARHAWTRIWEDVRWQLGRREDERTPRPPPIDLEELSTAVEACSALSSARSRSWSELRNAVRHAANWLPLETQVVVWLSGGVL